MNTTTVKIKKLNENAKIPTCGTSKSAGYDLYACIDQYSVIIEPHKDIKIGTGLAIELPDGYFGAIYIRSSLATKQGLKLTNSVGIVDSDYRGEYIVALYNDSDESCIITSGDRIAQLIVTPYMPVEFEEVDELSDTERGDGGFGSTGKN